MEYEKEIDQILRDLIFANWMSEDEYQEVLQETLNELGITKQVISNQLVKGVSNGHSVSNQLNIIRKMYGIW